MKRIRLGAAVAALALAAVVPAQAVTPPTKLAGTVGPGFTIGLKKAGKTFKTLKPGKYSLTVADKSGIHNFRIKGPGNVNRATSVVKQGTTTFALTLVKGTYTFVCDPHAGSMKGSFKVL
ncbi:MAG: plastocyanin/azurin family copper-binding protein [Gaiellaceae bacterium MAG52_C11]|nr:plastocyanin/azurin family copper-binding protein [Candidatus Gaiellasilicea maunaloa]